MTEKILNDRIKNKLIKKHNIFIYHRLSVIFADLLRNSKHIIRMELNYFLNQRYE